jgi:hypothetical protein
MADETIERRHFYVYEHWRSDKNSCFYVGKGFGGRAYRLKRNNPHHARTVELLRTAGLSVEIRIIASDLKEEEALNLERDRIQFYRDASIQLANVTDGGDGTSGYRFTDEQRAAMSHRRKGVARPPEWVENQAQSLRGRKKPENAARNKLPEVRRRAAIRCRETGTAERMMAAMTSEQMAERNRKVQASLSPERKKEIAKARAAKFTPEQRSERIRKMQASRTPEQRSASQLKAAQTRRLRRDQCV